MRQKVAKLPGPALLRSAAQLFYSLDKPRNSLFHRALRHGSIER